MNQLMFFAAGMFCAAVAAIAINAVFAERSKPQGDDKPRLSPDEWVISSEAMDAIDQAARDLDKNLLAASLACAQSANRTDAKSGCRLIDVDDVREALQRFQITALPTPELEQLLSLPAPPQEQRT